MSEFVLCPCCARHLRSTERRCPFCEFSLDQGPRAEHAPPPWYAVAALATTLTLSGCQRETAAVYGGPPIDPLRTAPPLRESVEIDGAPPPRLAEIGDDATVAPSAPVEDDTRRDASSRENRVLYGGPPPPFPANSIPTRTPPSNRRR